MTDIKTNAVNITDQNTRNVPAGRKDDKGREIGTLIHTYECDMVDTPDADHWFTIPAGHYYSAQIQQTRNGVIYGPIETRHYFVKEEDRDAEIERRIEKAATA